MLRRLHDLVASARPMPLSTSVMVNRDEVLDLLDETIERLPDELRAARWLLKEREEYLAKVKREGEDILDQARTRAERMVQRTEVVKASEARARKIVDAATDDAARIKNEVEDFCDQKLASFEIVLERTLKMVGAGRQKLQVSLNTGEEPAIGPRYDDEPGRPGGVRPGPRVVATMAQPILRIGVMELRRRPGTQRDVRVSTALPGLAITGARVPDDAELEVDATLESIDGAITVVGVVRVPWSAECRRCLDEVDRARRRRAPGGVRGAADRRRDVPDRG